MEFKESLKNRRSFYAIDNKSTIEDTQIIGLVEFAVAYTPSAFNSQSQMTAVLFGEKHEQLWDIVMETLRGLVPADHFSSTESKINGFKAGHGTVLFFNDDTITAALQKSVPLYADNFPVWAEQANGMVQFSVWNLLGGEGFGASLQHYNPLIDAQIQEAFGFPKNWRLIAQMPFGTPTALPGDKEFIDISTRVTVLGLEREQPEDQVCSAEFSDGCI